MQKLLSVLTKKSNRNHNPHWSGAYSTPVIVLGSQTAEETQGIPEFVNAKRIVLLENGVEVSFVVGNLFNTLIQSQEYKTLIRLGFTVEPCWGNEAFIRGYIDNAQI